MDEEDDKLDPWEPTEPTQEIVDKLKPKRVYKGVKNSTQGKRRATIMERTVIELDAKGLSGNQIAKLRNIAPATVSKILAKYKSTFIDTELVEEYTKLRQNLLNATEFKMLRSINDDNCIDRADLKQRAYALDRVHNMRRLDAGLSTNNTAKISFTVTDDDALEAYKKK
jgi:transposase